MAIQPLKQSISQNFSVLHFNAFAETDFDVEHWIRTSFIPIFPFTRLPISLMRNQRLSKEIRLLIFRFRRIGPIKGKQSIPAWIK